ncbi:hypothetical protein L903_03005 [Agrobacterium sp. JL28]|nr:hypothetical protein K538_26390 [Agrobacterium tumefaciens GW4]KVK52332.1 hypothetical protein L903_03005 [Agrobacterium sp. JL28]KVK53072.1 hypothetical protein L904_01895 [Agrobacterium sp. LY4]
MVEGTIYIADLVLGAGDLTAVVALQDDMGKAAASRAASTLLAKYDIGVISVIGIAGGLSNDVGIGDVCFTGPLLDVLENSKISETKKGVIKIEFNLIPYKTDPHLSFSFKYSSFGSDIKDEFEHWQLERFYASKELVPGEFIGRKNKNELIGIPRIHDGSIVCGSVSKSDLYKSNVVGIDRKLLAVETETGGVFSVADSFGVPVITVRGICDYADGNKNKLEEATGGATRTIAADNAMSFMALQLRNPQFKKFIQQRRDAIDGRAILAARKQAELDLVPNALNLLKDEVHSQLSKLSPEYQGKPAGYRLPLPRVRPSATNATISPSTQAFDPFDILEASARHRSALISVPKNYPDNGLPWIVAGELSLIEINGRQAVPVVINGDLIKPPSGTFQSQTVVDLSALNGRTDARPVFVIYDYPEGSKSRNDQLQAEQDRYEEAHFVFISKNKAATTDRTSLHLAVGAERFDLCEISFAELSFFFQRTFKLADQQASVIALRMQDMFEKFELNAHPTYFAGLSFEVLASLLKANRRAELLQLAVGGFLSFVVAGDEDRIVLSRTTREQFLRKLAFRIEVSGEEFTRPQLIDFVEKFAEERDFEIDSILFIKAFQDKGIIHFENSKVQISLPFISSYLLAAELKDNPQDALMYFNLDSDYFDFPTFDIYCELSTGGELSAKISKRLSEVIDIYNDGRPNQHILLTNDIRPVLVDHPRRFASLEEQIRNAVRDVIDDRPNSVEKQRIIDIASRVETSAREAQKEAEQEVDSGDNYQDIRRLVRIWTIAIVSLGSGSEQLGRSAKRELAELVVRAGSVILDASLRVFPSARFEALKAELKADENVRSSFGIGEDEAIDEEKRELLGALVDAYEFSLLGFPMRAVFEQLGNFAGQSVLRASVANVQSDNMMEQLVARIWAAEIDAVSERSSLLAAINALPPVPFLRHSLSTYFMTRVFWNHWEPANRLALLDAAEEALKPLSNGFDKGRLKRMVSGAGADKD